MKTIKTNDIKAMTKLFKLSDLEAIYLQGFADSINAEKSDTCGDLQFYLIHGTSDNAERRAAINALLIYEAAKAQADNDLHMALDKTSWVVADTLKCSCYQLMLWYKGLPLKRDRFGEHVECSDTFGLNYLEVTL